MTDSPQPVGLSPQQIAGLLTSMQAAVNAELAALPPEALAWHPAAREWCVKEALGHMIEAERRGFAGRVRVLLAQNEPALEGWNQVEVARERRDCERSGDELLQEFNTLRRTSIELVAGLQPSSLDRGGQHPLVGHLTIGEVVQEWAHHDRNHVRQILANVQAYLWPQMGNAQRFRLLEGE